MAGIDSLNFVEMAMLIDVFKVSSSVHERNSKARVVRTDSEVGKRDPTQVGRCTTIAQRYIRATLHRSVS